MFRSENTKKHKPAAGKVFFFILAGAAILVLVSAVVQFLWNAILAEVTDVRPISFLQALGLFVLAKILFGSLGFGHSRFYRHRGNDRRAAWREKWRHMSDAEKAEIKEKWRDHCRKRDH